jgi:hypothetical protein
MHYVHSLIGLNDIHVSKKDMDDQFCDIFNSNQALTPEGGDLNHLRNEACYLMMNIHQKYLLLGVNNEHIQDFIDPFQIDSDQIDDYASNCSSQLMSDDLSHNYNDSSWVLEDDDCSEIIVDDEQSNHHDTVGNTNTNHVNHIKYDVENHQYKSCRSCWGQHFHTSNIKLQYERCICVGGHKQAIKSRRCH